MEKNADDSGSSSSSGSMNNNDHNILYTDRRTQQEKAEEIRLQLLQVKKQVSSVQLDVGLGAGKSMSSYLSVL